MNRKHFLQAVGLLLGSVPILTARSQNIAPGLQGACVQPPFLQPGSVIGVTAPSGAVSNDEIAQALQLIRSWGYQVRVGKTIGKSHGYFSGTDAERAADLQDFLDDPQVGAIWCARGGYGLVRIVDRLDWTQFKLYPKWIIGFSDVTVLHCQLHRMGFASIHGQMLANTSSCFAQTRQLLEGGGIVYEAGAHPHNRPGVAEGVLVGGNLKLLETQAGTPTDLHTKGKILFIEDVGETLHNIDRMLFNLKRSGKLESLAALIVGGFSLRPGLTPEAFGATVTDMVLAQTETYPYPVCFNFAVGHQAANWPLKCGMLHRLEVSNKAVTLTEWGEQASSTERLMVRS